MVRRVNPKARATPMNPIPNSGNPAARTALPHPPKTSQNVPMNSARTFVDIDMAQSPQKKKHALKLEQIHFEGSRPWPSSGIRVVCGEAKAWLRVAMP